MEGMLNYFIPEDGDSSDHMNVVPLPRVDQLKLQHVKKSFPLPGDFHFRFKTAFEGTYVWLDVTNDQEPVPDYNGLIVSKVARVQQESTTRPPERVEVKAPPPPPPQAQPAPDLIETSSPPPPKREEPAAPAKAFNDDLVGLLADPIPATSPRATNAPPPQAPQQPAQGAQDPFNLFLGPAANTPMRPAAAPMNAPRGPPGAVNGPGAGGFPNGGYNPMGPRPTGSINISQMGQHIGMNQQPQGAPGSNSFSGLQWQGMGAPQHQQQQPRPGMGMPPNGNVGRQW